MEGWKPHSSRLTLGGVIQVRVNAPCKNGRIISWFCQLLLQHPREAGIRKCGKMSQIEDERVAQLQGLVKMTP